MSYTLTGTMIVFGVITVGCLYFEYCVGWSKIWFTLFLFTLLFSVFVGESVTASIKIGLKFKLSIEKNKGNK